MAKGDTPYTPSTRIELWIEEFLVRIIVGIGMAVLFLVMPPLLLGALNPWWFAATATLGFVVGFVGGDAVRERSPRVPPKARKGVR